MWPKNLQKQRSMFYSKLQHRLYTVIINVKLAETNTFFSLRLSKIKPIICITRSKPEQHNFCRPTTFSLRVATVLKYFCLRDSFIIQIGVERNICCKIISFFSKKDERVGEKSWGKPWNQFNSMLPWPQCLTEKFCQSIKTGHLYNKASRTSSVIFVE